MVQLFKMECVSIEKAFDDTHGRYVAALVGMCLNSTNGKQMTLEVPLHKPCDMIVGNTYTVTVELNESSP